MSSVCARRSRFFTWWSLGVVKVLHILLEVYLLIGQGRDQVHGPCWWKTPTEPKVYLFFSNLKHSEQDKVDG